MPWPWPPRSHPPDQADLTRNKKLEELQSIDLPDLAELTLIDEPYLDQSENFPLHNQVNEQDIRHQSPVVVLDKEECTSIVFSQTLPNKRAALCAFLYKFENMENKSK